jgi:hypothetical protein
MAQQFKVIVNNGKEQNAQEFFAQQGAGMRARPLVIQAQAGAKYQLVELGKGKNKITDLAPDNIKAKRVGKHLHLMFEADTQADVIIENYYDVMAQGYNGVIGKAENGSFYEYLTEDPRDPGLIPLLGDNASAVTQALGGAEVSPAGAALGVVAFSPLLGLLGLGAAGAAAFVSQRDKGVVATSSPGLKTALSIDPIAGDNVITPTEGGTTTTAVTGKVTGQFAAGDTVTLVVNGKSFTGAVGANGSYSINVPTADLKADGDTLIEGSVTGTGGDRATAAQDYVVEATATATQTALSIDPVTADNLISATEGGFSQIAVTGKVSGKFSAGDTVTLVVNGKSFTGTVGANGSYSINVPTADC